MRATAFTRHILGDGQGRLTGAAQYGGLGVERALRPSLCGVFHRFLMAFIASVKFVATTKFDRDDIQG